MKLPREMVEKLASFALKRLKDKNLVTFKTDEKKVLDRMIEAAIDDLKAEDKLDLEVEEMLKAHMGGMDPGSIDQKKMFNMIKHKLARERGIVL